MPTPDETLPKRALELAAALLKTGSVNAAARSLDLPTRTAKRYAQLPAFKSLVAGLRRELLHDAVGMLHGAARAAVATLRRKLRSDKDGDAIRAAVAVLDKMLAGAALLDLEPRVAEIERKQAARERGRK